MNFNCDDTGQDGLRVSLQATQSMVTGLWIAEIFFQIVIILVINATYLGKIMLKSSSTYLDCPFLH